MPAAFVARRVKRPFSELEIVRLQSAAYLEAGTLPIGAIGTIVFRHDGADAYEVEFADPVATVLTLRSSDLASSP